MTVSSPSLPTAEQMCATNITSQEGLARDAPVGVTRCVALTLSGPNILTRVREIKNAI